MTIDLPLETMTLEEKLQVMESVWADLCQNSETLLSPDWHGEVLKQRTLRLKSGQATISDWEEAKQRLRSLDS